MSMTIAQRLHAIADDMAVLDHPALAIRLHMLAGDVARMEEQLDDLVEEDRLRSIGEVVVPIIRRASREQRAGGTSRK